MGRNIRGSLVLIKTFQPQVFLPVARPTIDSDKRIAQLSSLEKQSVIQLPLVEGERIDTISYHFPLLIWHSITKVFYSNSKEKCNPI